MLLTAVFSPTRAEEAPRPKDPPWMALVQAESRKKPAPPPPGNGKETPPRASEEDLEGEEEGKARDQLGGHAPKDPISYNPFEEEEEEEESLMPQSMPEQELSEAEATSKAAHPWYGITPTSSPKTKKRQAPRAPNASPLGESPLLKWETNLTGIQSNLPYLLPNALLRCNYCLLSS